MTFYFFAHHYIRLCCLGFKMPPPPPFQIYGHAPARVEVLELRYEHPLGPSTKHHSRGYKIDYQFGRCLVCFSVNSTLLSRCVYAFTLITCLVKFVGIFILVLSSAFIFVWIDATTKKNKKCINSLIFIYICMVHPVRGCEQTISRLSLSIVLVPVRSLHGQH